MTGIFNPSVNTGGGSSYDNVRSIYRIRQLTLQDGVTIQPNSAVTAYGDIPLYEGYQPVGIPQLAIWDATSNGFGWGYASLGHSFIDFSTNKAYVLIHNTHTSSAINVQVIIFVLYMLNTAPESFSSNIRWSTLVIADNYTLNAKTTKTFELDCPAMSGYVPIDTAGILVENASSGGAYDDCCYPFYWCLTRDAQGNPSKIVVKVRNTGGPSQNLNAKIRVRARLIYVKET